MNAGVGGGGEIYKKIVFIWIAKYYLWEEQDQGRNGAVWPSAKRSATSWFVLARQQQSVRDKWLFLSLQYCGTTSQELWPAWGTPLKEQLWQTEWVQLWSQMIRRQKYVAYDMTLKELGLLSLDKKRGRGDHIAICSYLMGEHRKDGVRLFSEGHNKVRSNRYIFRCGKLREFLGKMLSVRG